MATHAIGKLKFNFSGDGAAFRWGDGAIHRLFGGKKNRDDAEYMEENPELDEQQYDDGYEGDPGYDDGYDDDPGYDDGYADDGYDDDPGYDDGYADDGYADDGYADDGYDDAGYDDGYADDGYEGDGYADDGYGDEGYEDGYDDRYSDEDAGYDGEYYASGNPVLRYVEENDWVTYLLLFLLPPLGVYLLWRRQRFDKPVRTAVSAASLVWFVVALILLFSSIFGGTRDVQQQPNITLAPVTATPAATASTDQTLDEPDATASADDGIGSGSFDGTDGTAPSPTPLTGGATSSQYVYSPASGLYYHNSESCSNIPEGVSVFRVLKDVAENNRRQSPCPVCIGSTDTTTYYGTRGGKYYHLDSTCSSMKNPITYTKEAAEKEGKQPCPVCVTKTQVSLSDNSVKFVTKDTTDRSGMNVYATKNGRYFHVRSDCSGMKGASVGSLKAALLAGKKACPNCCPAAGTTVYLTKNGKSYHLDPECQGMKGATTVTLAEAMVLGKSKCSVCIKKSLGSFSPSSVQAASTGTGSASSTADNASNASSSSEVYVYATRTGTYYHTNSTCSGMKGATRVTLKAMIEAKRKACPVCADNANTVVYATKGGTYYHSFAGCSGMRNASSGTQAKAIAAGYKRCPNCWSTTSSTSGSAVTRAAASSAAAQTSGTRSVAVSRTATASNTYVYATKAGSYYHSKSTCSGMKNASRVTLATAIKAGKRACPTCASAANRYVYSNSDGKYYHAASVCTATGMKNGARRTLAQALMLNQTACPKCITARRSSSLNKGGTYSAAAKAKAKARAAARAKYVAALKKLSQRKVHSFSSGTSGVKVYVPLTGKLYHTKSGCSGSKLQRRVSLETALNYGYTACPKCARKANQTVYATKGGKYYHRSKTDAGVGATKGTLSVALATGYKACPYCVKKTRKLKKVASFTVGRSGIKVYTTHANKYYHSRANCSGMKHASRIALETALNYGKKACPVCLSSARHKVYVTKGSKYYHRYKSHAGSGAKAVSLATAKARGRKACPNCVAVTTGSKKAGNGGTKSAPVSTVKYAAAASTSVYINPSTANNYYHKSRHCSKAKFSGGTKVTLKYVLDWHYKACPYCNPPTSIG